MKKIIILFFISIFIPLMTSCASLLQLEKPKADLSHVLVRDTNLVGTTLIFVVDVENPNDRELKVDDVSYKVFLGGKAFAQASTGKQVSVPAKSKSQIEIPLPVKYTEIFSNMGEILLSQKLTYKIEGTAKLSFISIPFTKEGVVNFRGE